MSFIVLAYYSVSWLCHARETGWISEINFRTGVCSICFSFQFKSPDNIPLCSCFLIFIQRCGINQSHKLPSGTHGKERTTQPPQVPIQPVPLSFSASPNSFQTKKELNSHRNTYIPIYTADLSKNKLKKISWPCFWLSLGGWIPSLGIASIQKWFILLFHAWGNIPFIPFIL